MKFPEYLELYIKSNPSKIAAMKNTYEQEASITALNAINTAFDSMMNEGQQMNAGELSFATHQELLELYNSIYH